VGERVGERVGEMRGCGFEMKFRQFVKANLYLLLLVPSSPGLASSEEARHFDIQEFRVEGNSLLPGSMIEEAVEPFLGPDRTAADVEHARGALDQLYAKHGYPIVTAEVPEQDPSDGVVILKVTQRTVGRLRINGSRYFLLSDIRERVPSVREGQVPNLNDLQREIITLNQWPDRRVTPLLRPGIAPGTVDVDLNVKDTLPLSASVELASRRSANTTSLRSTGTLTYGNLWQRGDSITLSYQYAPERPADSAVLTATYLYRIPDSNMSLTGSVMLSESSVTTVGSTGVIGKGQVVGVRLQIPLGNDDIFSHSASIGFDYKDMNSKIILGSDQTATPVVYMPLIAQYQANWFGQDEETLLDVSAVLGTRGIGSDATAFDQKRYGASAGFSYLRGSFTRRDTLPFGFQSSIKIAGQGSNDPLISNEQFAIGGVDTVRGYLEAEAIGDYGGTAQLELRGPTLTDVWTNVLGDLRPFGFYDTGLVRIRQALVGQRRGYALASTGVGVRMHLLEYFSADFIGARILATGANSHDGADRLLFRLNGAF
jgi:hemolysin activation/secretion protein